MLIHSHDYDNSFYPAMPAVEIQLFGKGEHQSVTLEAIVDSGADVSMIPTRYLRQLNLRKRSSSWLTGVTGGRYEVDVYSVLVKIGRYDPFYIEVVASERRDEIIVGRDILNQFNVSLNGLAGVVEIFS